MSARCNIRVLLAPSKEMDFTTAFPSPTMATTPAFQSTTTSALCEEFKTWSASKLGSELGCSSALAQAAHGNFQAWSSDTGSATTSSPACYAYSGVAFKKLSSRTIVNPSWMHSNLLVFDPLYGIVRATDTIQPYRMELGQKIKGGGTLAGMWKSLINDHLAAESSSNASTVLIDASSQEYGKSLLDRKALSEASVRILTVDFLQANKKCSSVHAKQSRGVFARWCCDNDPMDVAALQGFDAEGYSFVKEEEEEDGHCRFVFNRSGPPAAAAKAASAKGKKRKA
jgi:cytoplasmic iron level regulating protein YaaA (DUF328/UPF0246 family)